mmetsp:Transcript_94575/g.264817  ORF Transcript_94575/g.264817 Transcript_94575/m.264817 type:complete len:212 (+) Transcript_94575:311-946(+)
MGVRLHTGSRGPLRRLPRSRLDDRQGHGAVQELARQSLHLHVPLHRGRPEPGLWPGRCPRLGRRGVLRGRPPHRRERQAARGGDVDLLRPGLQGLVHPQRHRLLPLRRLHRPRRGQGPLRHRRLGSLGALRGPHGRRDEGRGRARRGRAGHRRGAWQREGRLRRRRGQQAPLRPPHQGARRERLLPLPRPKVRRGARGALQGLRRRGCAEP